MSHVTASSKFGRPRGCKDSTTAKTLITAADNAISQSAIANENADKMRETLAKMDKEMQKMFSAILPNGNDALDSARIRTHECFRGIVNGIRDSIDKYSNEYFERANAAQLHEALSFATKLYNQFPQFFPVPENEKRA